MLKELLEVFASLTNTPATELETQLFNEDGSEKSKDDVAGVLKDRFGARFKQLGDAQLARGKKETLTNLEKSLKAEFGIESDLQGFDLVKHIAETNAANAVEAAKREGLKVGGKKIEELAWEDIQALPVVKAKIDESKRVLATDYQNLKNEYEGYKKTTYQKQVSGVLQKEIENFFHAEKIPVSTNPDIKSRQVNAVLNLINLSELKLNDDGKLIVVDKEGEPKKDDHYQLVKVTDLIRNANPFEPLQFDPNKSGGGAGNDSTGQNGKQQATNAPDFKNENELMAFLNSPDATSEQKKAAIAKFESTAAAK